MLTDASFLTPSTTTRSFDGRNAPLPVTPAGAQLYAHHQATIDSVIAAVARGNRLSPDETEEFAGDVRLRLLENDCEVLRKFKGQSTMRTFLVVVVRRLLLDRRTQAWGRWRPSMAARRLGPVAVRLETLVLRDGFSFEHAHETLRTNHGVTETRAQLETLLARLPRRCCRRRVRDDDEIEAVSTDALGPDERLLRMQASRTLAVLEHTMATLTPRERLLIRLRFFDQLRVSEIARLCGLDQKSLYRTLASLLQRLRQELQRQGIDRAEVAPWLGQLDTES